MKSTAVIVSVLTSAAVAQPHLGHHRRAHHQHPHDKRALEIVWETEWVTEIVTAFVDEVTTEYVQATPTPATSTSSTTTTISVPTSTSKAVPAEFFPSSSSVAPVPSPSTTHTTLIPVVVPTSTSTPVVVETPVYVPTVQSSSPVVQAVVPSSSSPAPAATSQASSGNGGGSASGGSKYTGEMTYYAIGMGACGFDDSGKDQTDHVVALSSQLMGAQSNGNPMCGKTITITNGDVTTTAQVRDKCPSCATGAIDVSEAVFKLVFGGLDAGRKPVTWWFNE